MRAFLLLAAMTQQSTVPLSDGLTIGGVVRGGRVPVSVDLVQSQLVAGAWKFPSEGDLLKDAEGKEHKWAKAPAANKEGWIESSDLEAGYFSVRYRSPRRQIMLLLPQGASMAYVNGAPAIGDPYGFGYVKLPIVLEEGDNDFLFACGRGQVRASLEAPTSPLIVGGDMTCPDFPEGKNPPYAWVGVQLINASESAEKLNRLVAYGKESAVDLNLPALSTRKVTLKVPIEGALKDLSTRAVELRGPKAKVTFKIPYRMRKAGETYKVTFQSAIDGSAQYYAVRPALKPDPGNALVLSLHGASVEASGQADAYGPKTWASIVCPTNRRPYGFDWEDWGRLDALEVLEHARKRIAHDDSRIQLTGHSMGGHGSWHMSTTFPDKFAAVGPSAGWVSFASYAGGLQATEPTEVEKTLLDAASASDTLARVRNLKPLGVYILHGDADDNVPVAQARQMRDALKPFHEGLGYFEQPGAGHWWNIQQDEPGASCLDWAPMYDLFARRRLPRPSEMRDLEFSTASPNISASCFWATIDQQIEQFKLSTINLHVDPNQHRISGTTTNVASLTLRTSELFGDDKPVKIVLDGQSMKDVQADHGAVSLTRGKTWFSGGVIPPTEKNPLRGSGFKQALTHRIVLVYGTHGTRKENVWMEAKAKFDAQAWWYRGNGDLELMEDDAYDAQAQKGRDVLLIGNQETNSAWPKLLRECPIDVTPRGVRVGKTQMEGDDKVVLFCRPTETAMVACVGVTGLPSMRIAERLPYFVSGVAYPDYTVIDPQVLKLGTKGVLAAGWFDNKWKLPK